MKLKTLKIIFIFTVFIAITLRANNLFINAFSPNFDMVSTATYIVDGDTFDIVSGDSIRLQMLILLNIMSLDTMKLLIFLVN